jgi:hypothetical protein
MTEWIVYEQNGLGVVESPLEPGKALGVFVGTKDEVEVYCRAETLKLHGGKLTGWDSPTIWYQPAIRPNKPIL